MLNKKTCVLKQSTCELNVGNTLLTENRIKQISSNPEMLADKSGLNMEKPTSLVPKTEQISSFQFRHEGKIEH